MQRGWSRTGSNLALESACYAKAAAGKLFHLERSTDDGSKQGLLLGVLVALLGFSFHLKEKGSIGRKP